MATLGEEVADAYISVHADTAAFRRDMQKLRVSSSRLFKQIGTEAGRRFQRAWTKEVRGISLQSLARRIRAQMQSLARTISTDFRIIAAVISDRLIAPINRGLTRAVNQVIVSVGRAKDAVLGFGRDVGSVFGGQVGDQLLRVRVLVDQISPSLRGIKNGFLDTAVALREMVAPGLLDRFTDTLRGAALHTRVMGQRAVEELREGFSRTWNSDLMVAVRAHVRDLVAAMRSGLALLDSVTDRAFLGTAARVEAGAQRISAAVSSMWTRITTRSKKGAKESTSEVERFAEATQGALFDLATSAEKHSGRADKAVNTQFIGRLKGSRNDALNAIGAIGGAFENLISGVITKGFGILGTITSKVGEIFVNAGPQFGSMQGPLNMVGAMLLRAGAAMTAASATGVGLVVVLGVLIATFFATGAAVALLSTLLSALIGIVVALTASLAFAVSGVLLALGPMALAAAAGVGALAAAFTDLSDEQKAAFDPLKKTFKDLQKVVRENLFRNLAGQIQGLNDILNQSVAPLLVGAASALSGVIDYMIAAFQRPEVKASLDTLSLTLPGILTSLGTAFTDMITGVVGFFAAVAPNVGDIAAKIGEIATKFSDWANSAAGQEQIKEFFDKARDSASILWGVIQDVGKALGILFSDGKADGDDMIAKIGEIIAKFTTWAEDEDNRQKIKDWFTDAKTVAGQLFDAVSTISQAIKDLDTPENRKALQSLLSALNTVLAAVNWVAQAFQNLPAVIAAVKNVVFLIPGMGNVLASIDGIIDGIKWINQHMPGGGGAPAGRGTGGPLPHKAGGILNSPTRILAGEAGREMIVPLVRPLNQVDPSVRAVSAFARGLDNSAFNGGAAAGKVVNIHSGAVQVTAATDNEGQVANAVLDRLVARWK